MKKGNELDNFLKGQTLSLISTVYLLNFLDKFDYTKIDSKQLTNDIVEFIKNKLNTYITN